MNNSDKAKLVQVFEDTMALCRKDEYLNSALDNSLKNQYILKAEESISLTRQPESTPANIIVSTKRTIEAAEQYKDSKVCVLNFASSKNPGGGVVRGARAQEECICRITTLYPCLASDEVMNGFYLPHRTMFHDTLYNDDLIFTPNIICLKTDTSVPELRSREEWFNVDVITCASPNLGAYTKVTDDVLEKIQLQRLERVFLTSVKEGSEVLILGAFGCGAFRNPPEVVAKVMKQLCEKYAGFFRTIEFAVYCTPKNPKNYEVFRDILQK